MAQTSPESAIRIEQAQTPADWTRYQFRGFGFSLPPGWVEMERSDAELVLFGGDVEKRVGPGFGLMLSESPMSIFDPGTSRETGQVSFTNGQTFRRFEALESPADGLVIHGDILISKLPLWGKAHLIILLSSYSEPLAAHRALFDQILAGLTVPAVNEVPREPVLGGAFLTPVPEGWETGSYDDDEVLTFRQKGLPGEVRLFRHAADSVTGWLNPWYIPDAVQPVAVMMLGQPALLYEWAKDPKSLADGSDDDAVSRVYVFETCLPGPDTLSISLEGLPSFHAALAVQSLLDAMDLPAQPGSAPCAAANLPRSASVGAPQQGRRQDSGYTLYIAPHDRQDWTTQTYAGHGFALPAGWTGGDNGQGAVVYLSSTGQYQISFSHADQPPVPRGARAEVRLVDGTRFLRYKEIEGETLISVTPTGSEGHLVINVTGGMLHNDTFLGILATLRLAPPIAAGQPQKGSALDGLLAYDVPVGWQALIGADSVTLAAEDGRGYLTVAKGAAVLPPYGLAALVPPGRLGSYAEGHGKSWTEYGWPSPAPEFMDAGHAVTGWHFLNILRGCLPGQEPVAIAWGGIPRFLARETLKDLKSGLVFAWPEAMEACALENAGVGADSASTSAEPIQPEVSVPDPVAKADPVVTSPALAPAPSPADASPAPTTVDTPKVAQVPPPPPVVAEPVRPDPDSFTEGPGGYGLYQNARYDTFISYPTAYFRPQPAPDSGDGRTFVSTDGAARFIVFAQYNALGLSQADMARQDKDTGGYDDVTYQKSGDGWYVLSGHVGSDIFYRRVIIAASELVQVFEITYPSRLKQDFDPVVTYMAQSFGPGSSPAAAPAPQTDVLPAVRVDRLTTPARQTELRIALMDAARAPIEAEIGRKVIFVVSVLRTDGNWAYLQAVPHNPDGTSINWDRTPFAAEMSQGVMSDVAMVLMRKVDGRWQVEDHIFGPTDVYWYAWVDAFGLPEALFVP